ncbi:hypothetical protein GCM10022286_06920 [Gryllotalpicola daejeonensis]|uniref:DUF6993 domain-containing protein n=1 Tax=Gryllotalpicola daejeonensis TaxID=993087 RepID=A0ABP7ZFW0_9MICO
MQFGRVAVVGASAVLALTLAGCTAAAAPQGAAPTQTSWSEEPSTGGDSGTGATTFDAKGTAASNRAAFDAAITRVVAKNAKASGSAVAASLKSAGFPMNATQITASKTSADLQPGSIMVGVKVGADCLVGQWGSAVDGYHSTITPVLASGGCLIGGIPPVG